MKVPFGYWSWDWISTEPSEGCQRIASAAITTGIREWFPWFGGSTLGSWGSCWPWFLIGLLVGASVACTCGCCQVLFWLRPWRYIPDRGAASTPSSRSTRAIEDRRPCSVDTEERTTTRREIVNIRDDFGNPIPKRRVAVKKQPPPEAI